MILILKLKRITERSVKVRLERSQHSFWLNEHSLSEKKKKGARAIGKYVDTPLPGHGRRPEDQRQRTASLQKKLLQCRRVAEDLEYFAFNLAISFQSPLRLTLGRAFATKGANFVEDWKI